MFHHVKLLTAVKPFNALLILLPCPCRIRDVIQALIQLACHSLRCLHNILLQINHAHLLVEHIDIVADLLRKHICLTNPHTSTKPVKLSLTPSIGELGEGVKAPRKPLRRWGKHALLDVGHCHNAFRLEFLCPPPNIDKLLALVSHQVVTGILVACHVLHHLALTTKQFSHFLSSFLAGLISIKANNNRVEAVQPFKGGLAIL